MIRTLCRSCQGDSLNEVLSLGDLPLANAFLTSQELARSEELFPLDLMVCIECGLLQLEAAPPPAMLFREYAYFSSHSYPTVEHALRLAKRIIREHRLTPSSIVYEIASNDGYLLQHYARSGVRVLGIEPARNIATVAREKGVDTLTEFFTSELAHRLRLTGAADVIHAHNVMAHVPTINDLVSGIHTLLKEDGVLILETPYAIDMLNNVEFDTIYHEHVFYYTVHSLEALLRRHGLSIWQIEHLDVHGGSLRVFAGKPGKTPGPSVAEFRRAEADFGVTNFASYSRFATRVQESRQQILSFLDVARSQGRRIAGYGAAAKATVMLNVLRVGADTIEYVVDSTPYKQGRFIPGARIPIVPPDRLREDPPDDVVIFAWNFANDIRRSEIWFENQGGRFVVPLPVPRPIGDSQF